jgi:hypothetical protein
MGKKFDQPSAEEDPIDLNLLEASELAAILEAKWRGLGTVNEDQKAVRGLVETDTGSNKLKINRTQKSFSLKRLLASDDLIGLDSISLKSRDNLIDYLIHSGVDSNKIDEILPAVEKAINVVTKSFQEAAVGPEDNKSQTLQLPDEAPEFFVAMPGRPKKGADIVSFLRRVWGPWIKEGVLTRAHLGRLDPAAYQALTNHLKTHDLPPDLNIPTLSDLHKATVPDEVAAIVEQADDHTLRAIRALVARKIRSGPNNS